MLEAGGFGLPLMEALPDWARNLETLASEAVLRGRYGLELGICIPCSLQQEGAKSGCELVMSAVRFVAAGHERGRHWQRAQWLVRRGLSR